MTASVNEEPGNRKEHGRWQQGTTNTTSDPLALVLARLDWTQHGNEYTARCPAHDDKTPSLTVKQAPDRKVLLHCFAECKPEAIVTAIGLTLADLFPAKGKPPHLVGTYDYLDERGTLLYQSVRYTPKNFKQRRPDGHGGWLSNLQGVRLVLYRLPELLQAETVYVPEGEKDVDTLRGWGLVATCNPMGAGNWRDEYNQSLAGKHVVILPDHDEAGEKHALKVARALLPVAASVKLVRLPDLPTKGDVTDWRNAGHTKEELLALVEAAPLWTEEDDSPRGEHPSSEPAWPELADEALYGLAGEIVNTIDPYTEADPVAVLLNVLTAFGNCINAAPHARVQHDQHPANLFVVQVGDTSKGRKGTGWSTPRYLMSLCDKDWSKNRVKSGLSSGEGLIFNVRDPIDAKVPIKEKGRFTGEYDEVRTDQGEADKRLLIIEPEFASTLTVMAREGNTLSAIIRQAWDSGDLSPLTKNNPVKATGAHISILGHITKQELLARLDDTSKANGFANRFLWALVKRSKELPEGGAVPEEALLPLAEKMTKVLTFARTVTEVKRDEEARELWAAVYHDLSEGKPGMLGAVLGRAEAQVLRLSVSYALLDMTAIVRAVHLRAALALWEYCERSAVLIFGERLGDPTADRILEALRNAGTAGMAEKEIYDLFGGHKSANERARALNLLQTLGLAASESVGETGGRPRTLWKAAY